MASLNSTLLVGGGGTGFMAGGGALSTAGALGRGALRGRRPMALRKMLSSSSMELETGWVGLGLGGGGGLAGGASSLPRSCFSFARSFFQAMIHSHWN